MVARIVVKVAIRNVRARDGQGTMRHHAKRPCDPARELANMNAIWRPAHEAGHYIGDMPHEGTETKLLMRGEGSGYQIPFKLAKRFRDPS